MSQSPALQMEAKANREAARLLKAHDELAVIAGVIKHSELPPEIKLRLAGALRAENELLAAEQLRIDGLRKAAQVSRGPQWVTSGDE